MFPAPDLPEGMRLVTKPLSKEMLPYLNEIDEVVRECAEDWPNEYLETPDGREFRLLVNGSSIVTRFRELNAADREWLNRLGGAIVEIGTDEKPLYLLTDEEVDPAWEALQESYGVKAEEWPK